MTAAQVDAVERTTALLTRFSLSTAAPELGQRLESAGHREAAPSGTPVEIGGVR